MDLKEPIITQEKLDEVIKDRLERAEKKVREEFADYEDLKAKAEQLDELKQTDNEALKKALEESEKLKGELEARTKADEIAEMRRKIAKATGVPEELIKGDDEEGMTAFANDVAAFAKKPAAPRLGESGRSAQGEPSNKSNADVFAKFCEDIFG